MVCVLAHQDQTTAPTVELLVRAGRREMSVIDRALVEAGRDQAGDVRDVRQEEGTDLVGNGTEARPVDAPGVCRRAADDELGAMLER